MVGGRSTHPGLSIENTLYVEVISTSISSSVAATELDRPAHPEIVPTLSKI